MSDSTELKEVQGESQPIVVNEPAEAAAVEKAVDGTMYGGLLFAIVMFIVLVFVVIGTPVTWFKLQVVGGADSKVTIWSVATNGVPKQYPDDFCTSAERRFRGAEAFAIISIFGALVSVVLGFVHHKSGGLKVPCMVLGLFTFGATLICWGVAYDLYYRGFCGAPSFYAQHYQIQAGGALFPAAFVLSFIAVVLLLIDPVAVYGAAASRFTLIAFTLLMLLSLVFVVIGTCVNFFTYEDSHDRITITLWQITTMTYGGGTNRQQVKDFANCDPLLNTFQAAEAFAIISIFFTLAAFLAGLRTIIGFVNDRWQAFFAGGMAAISALITWAIAGRLYNGDWCDKSIHLQQNDFLYGAGFALFVAAFVVATIATLLLGAVTVLQRVMIGKPAFSVRPVTILFIFFIGAAFLLCVVGASQDVAYAQSSTSQTNIKWWYVDFETSTATSHITIDNYFAGCFETHRYKTGQAMTVLSSFFTFCALVLGCVQLYRPERRVLASVIGLVASIFILINWGIGIALYHDTFCGKNLAASGFWVGAGVGMYVAAWVLTVLISLLNLLVA